MIIIPWKWEEAQDSEAYEALVYWEAQVDDDKDWLDTDNLQVWRCMWCKELQGYHPCRNKNCQALAVMTKRTW